jgi:hypothetical protein
MIKVLKVRREELVYQVALVSDELREIYDESPVDPTILADAAVRSRYESMAGAPAKPQKPLEEGDICAICYEDLRGGEQLVYCKSGCGKSLHTACFKEWQNHARGGEVNCVYCRAVWVSDGAKPASSSQEKREGYVNLQRYQSGMSGERDTSTYSAYNAYDGRKSWKRRSWW